MSICREFPVQELLLFTSILVALLLSWEDLFYLFRYSWWCINIAYHILYGTWSLVMTSYASVELFVFNVCLLGLQWVTPNPMDITPLVWLFIPWCTEYDISTCVNILFRFVAPKHIFSLRVQWTNLNIFINFPSCQRHSLIPSLSRNSRASPNQVWTSSS